MTGIQITPHQWAFKSQCSGKNMLYDEAKHLGIHKAPGHHEISKRVEFFDKCRSYFSHEKHSAIYILKTFLKPCRQLNDKWLSWRTNVDGQHINPLKRTTVIVTRSPARCPLIISEYDYYYNEKRHHAVTCNKTPCWSARTAFQ